MIFIPFDRELVRGDGGGPWIFIFAENGSPVDVSGWTVFYTAKTEKDDVSDDAGAALSYDSVNDTTAIAKSDSGSGTTDTITITPLAADTGNMAVVVHFHDVQRTASGEDPWTFAMGDLALTGDVSRRTTT